jgi:hypothetical protein
MTLASLSLGFGVVQLDVTIVNTALNSISTSMGGGVSELQWPELAPPSLRVLSLPCASGMLGSAEPARTKTRFR